MNPLPTPPQCPTVPWTQRDVHGKTVYDGLTQATFEAFKLTIKKYETDWNEFINARINWVNQYAQLLVAEGFPATYRKQVRGGSRPSYMTVTLAAHLSECLPKVSPTHPYIGYAQKYLEEETKKIREKENTDSQNALTDRAVKWLLDRGCIYGEQFTAPVAVSVANDIAYEKEVEKRRMEIAASPDAFVEFCGSDYCENCPGWDGESHRCACGNRRVSWTTGDGHSFESPSIYAEAY